ncbi:hypothetical protein HDZ31DRAFT_49544, partial [Schizophyllum fasciatum]
MRDGKFPLLHRLLRSSPSSLLLFAYSLPISFTCSIEALNHPIPTGHPDYGCFIAREKTLTNFDYDEQVMNII